MTEPEFFVEFCQECLPAAAKPPYRFADHRSQIAIDQKTPGLMSIVLTEHPGIKKPAFLEGKRVLNGTGWYRNLHERCSLKLFFNILYLFYYFAFNFSGCPQSCPPSLFDQRNSSMMPPDILRLADCFISARRPDD